MLDNAPEVSVTEHQAIFLQKTCRFPAFVAGFGAGKSEAMTLSAFSDASHSSSALIGLYAPTYDLIKLITAPRMCAKLTEMGVPHVWNKQDSAIYTSYPRFGDFIMRTMDNPERIVGYETYRSHLDEIDTLKKEQAENVWNKVIARNRQQPDGVSDPQNRVSVYTTPEGFRFVYDRWVKKGGPNYEIVQAPTWSNSWLPADYIESLLDTYPAQLVRAYIDGDFVNLTSGTIYSSFDRKIHASTETIRGNEPLFIGQDFNVGNMASVVNVKRGDNYHVVGEMVEVEDTPALINLIDSLYPNNPITIFPDATGRSRKTVNASKTDIKLLRNADYSVRAKGTNPPVKDRILSVNSAYVSGRLKVNLDLAPRFTEAQEQQVYAKNGEPDKSGGVDHPNDAEGYFVHYTMPVKRTTFTQPEEEQRPSSRYFKKQGGKNWKTQ